MTNQFILDSIVTKKSPIVKSHWELGLLKIKIFRLLFRLISQNGIKLIQLIKLIPRIETRYRDAFGETFLSKVVKVDNRYFWRFGTPGFPSLAANETATNEIFRTFPTLPDNGKRSLLIFFAITKKCPLNCEHCYDWSNHNLQDSLSSAEICQIVHKFQDNGTTQISFSGGEPMLRVNDIHKVLKVARPWTDFWINTSGLGINKKRARELKKSGLTGVMVSLDHYEASKHDKFRGFDGSFNLAIQAIINSNNAGLVTGLSLCTTKAFISSSNMAHYMDMAKDLGVSFVQFIEPRAAGRYSGQNVELDNKEINFLEETYLKYNTRKEFSEYPIINYVGYQQRRMGCAGGGNRYFYIDADGDAHICPICTNKVANTLQFSAQDVIMLLNQNSCHGFQNETFSETLVALGNKKRSQSLNVDA